MKTYVAIIKINLKKENVHVSLTPPQNIFNNHEKLKSKIANE